jgi:SnoaL-like domain
MPSTADVARDYTALLLAGQFAAAGEQFWAADIKSIEPRDLPGVSVAEVTGIDLARTKNMRWFEAQRIDDLTIDGPFVTGNQFALFMDMMITNRANGDSQPFTQIAVFTVRDAKITEERYFYD